MRAETTTNREDAASFRVLLTAVAPLLVRFEMVVDTERSGRP